MAKTKKPNVKIGAGATVVIETDTGAQHRFTCTGSNEVTKKDYHQVLKNLQDCIERSIKEVAASSKRH